MFLRRQLLVFPFRPLPIQGFRCAAGFGGFWGALARRGLGLRAVFFLGVIGCQGLILRTSHGFADRTTGQMRSTSFSWTAHLSSCWHGTIPGFHRRKHMCRDWRCILPSQPRTALQTPSRPLKRLLCTNAVTLHHPCSTPLANLEESRPLQRADNLGQCSIYAAEGNIVHPAFMSENAVGQAHLGALAIFSF